MIAMYKVYVKKVPNAFKTSLTANGFQFLNIRLCKFDPVYYIQINIDNVEQVPALDTIVNAHYKHYTFIWAQ